MTSENTDIIRPSLDDLANKYWTDKGSQYSGPSRHGYASFYDKVLSPIRDKSIRMLEVGVCMEGTSGGHSILMWREYFEKASIYTFDIVDMSNHPAITSYPDNFFFRGDQGNRDDLTTMYKTYGNLPFDFILEDGSHTTEHQMISLGHLFKYVKSGGVYFLEDISIPNHQVCCIRNDETFETIDRFQKTGEFISQYMTDEESDYLKKNIKKIELFTDVQDAYMTAAIFKK